STRQRFIALDFDFLPPEHEARIVVHESGVDEPIARQLCGLGQRLRELRDRGLAEVPSTRLLVSTARLIAGGVSVRRACHAGIVAPLSNVPALAAAMRELVDATFV